MLLVNSLLFSAGSSSKRVLLLSGKFWSSPLAQRRGHSIRQLSDITKKISDLRLLEPVTQPEIFSPEQRLQAAQARIKSLGPYVSRLPEKWIPFAELMRLDKPVGTWLLYLPCTWAITMAAFVSSAPLTLTLFNFAVFGVGSVVLRGFGCTINDLIDARLDSQVIRTIERPIASGRVTPQQAVKFLAAQLTIGCGILLCLPLDCFLLGASSLLLVCTYPLFKRFTYYPQAILSLAFNWGALLGSAAMGVWNWSVMVPLYLSTWFWTMIYDTVYAHQDKKFDVKAGIKSTALAWGDHSKRVFATMLPAQLGLLGVAAYNCGMLTTPGFVVGASIFSYRLISSLVKVDLDDAKQCWAVFTRNIGSGKYLTAGLFLDYLLKIFGFL